MMIPTFLIAATSLSPGPFLVFGSIGTAGGIIYLMLYSSELSGVSSRELLTRVLLLFAASTAIVFGAAGTRWALNAVDGAKPMAGPTWALTLIALKVGNFPYWMLPGLILFFFLAWPLRLLISPFREILRNYFVRLSARFGPDEGTAYDSLGSGRFPTYLLIVSVALSLFVGLYPYLPRINPAAILFGFDVRVAYFPTGQKMAGLDLPGAIGYAFNSDRVVYWLFQYGLSILLGSVDLAVRIVPALLASFLVLSTYLFVRTWCNDRLLAATSSLFSVFSFLTVTGVNGGLYADWLATSEALIFLSLLSVGLRRTDMRFVAASAGASILMLYTHPWTWLATLGVVVAYVLFTAVHARITGKRGNLRFEVVSISLIIAFNAVVDVSRSLLVGSSGLRVAYGSTASSLSLANIPNALDSLRSTVLYYLGSALDNSLIVVLAVIGILTMADLGNRMNRLVLAWTAVTSVGIFLSGYSPLQFYQARILLLVPLHIPAAMGLAVGVRHLSGLMGRGSGRGDFLARLFIVLVYVSVFGAMLAYALEDVGSLYTGTGNN